MSQLGGQATFKPAVPAGATLARYLVCARLTCMSDSWLGWHVAPLLHLYASGNGRMAACFGFDKRVVLICGEIARCALQGGARKDSSQRCLPEQRSPSASSGQCTEQAANPVPQSPTNTSADSGSSQRTEVFHDAAQSDPQAASPPPATGPGEDQELVEALTTRERLLRHVVIKVCDAAAVLKATWGRA